MAAHGVAPHASPSPPRWDPRYWIFDIDRFLNPLVPPPPWPYLPTPVSWFLGYRKPDADGHGPKRPYGNLLVTFWAFVGVFCGIAVVTAVSESVPEFATGGGPIILGSFGAAAVLEFLVIDSPLSQPRNAIVGQLIASLVGVSIAKLFLLLGSTSSDPGTDPRFQAARWAGGALACATATAVMSLTKTVHPPAGATALMAVVDDGVRSTGWILVPIVLCGCSLMLAVALVVNNVQRRFPVYWWTAGKLGTGVSVWSRVGRGKDGGESGGQGQGEEEEENDVKEAFAAGSTVSSAHVVEEGRSGFWRASGDKDDGGNGGNGSDGRNGEEDSDESDESSLVDRKCEHQGDLVVVRRNEVIVPESVAITEEERGVLDTLSRRI